jgi:hypothetical protein
LAIWYKLSPFLTTCTALAWALAKNICSRKKQMRAKRIIVPC